MAKISGKAGRAMAAVPTGQPTGLTRKQAQDELNVVRTYETTVLTGFSRRASGGVEMQDMALQLRVRQQAGKFIPDVTVINKVTGDPMAVFGPLRAATYADALSSDIGDVMRRAIRAAEVAGR